MHPLSHQYIGTCVCRSGLKGPDQHGRYGVALAGINELPRRRLGFVRPAGRRSRAPEHGVVADPAPAAAEFLLDGDEFEGGATVRAGK